MSSPQEIARADRTRKIFLAARATFAGHNADIRNFHVIGKTISQNERSFRKVLNEFGKETVINITLSLLAKGVFHSEINAKLLFPELYEISAVRGAQRHTSQQQAARSEANALKEVSRSDDIQYGAEDGGIEDDDPADATVAEDQLKPTDFPSPSLFPVYLSYTVQHKLLNAVQRILEESCYDFAAKCIPSVLAEQKWDCAEAVELNRWSEILLPSFNGLNADTNALAPSEDFLCTLKATHSIRHAAVHRLPTSGRGLEKMLENALHMVQVFDDRSRAERIGAILKHLQVSIEDMESSKVCLETRLDEKLNDIQRQREQLDRNEAEAKAHMLKQDHKSTMFISSILGQSIAKMTQDGVMEEPGQGDLGAESNAHEYEEKFDSNFQTKPEVSPTNGLSALLDDSAAGSDAEPVQAEDDEASSKAYSIGDNGGGQPTTDYFSERRSERENDEQQVIHTE